MQKEVKRKGIASLLLAAAMTVNSVALASYADFGPTASESLYLVCAQNNMNEMSSGNVMMNCSWAKINGTLPNGQNSETFNRTKSGASSFGDNFKTFEKNTQPGSAEEAQTYFIADILEYFGWKSSADFINNFGKSDNIFKKIGSKSILWGAFNGLLSTVIGLSGAASTFFYFSNSLDHGKRALSSIKKFFTKKSSQLLGKGNLEAVAPEEGLRRWFNGIKNIKGQKTALEKLTGFISEILYEKEMNKQNGETYDHGDVFYVVGSSGSGKTLTSFEIAKALYNEEPLVISASEVDTQYKDSIVSQLFSFHDYYSYHGEEVKPTKIVQYVQNHKQGCIIINEYDKIRTPELDEILRTIHDMGVISIRSNELDMRGFTVIITSNESLASMTAGNQQKDVNIDDGTGSRTAVEHDKSFVNRLKVVEFENLKPEAYEEIIEKEYSGKYLAYWEEKLGIKLDFGNTIKKVAERAAKENTGARTIKNVFSALTYKLSCLKASPSYDANEKDYVISYDNVTDKFYVLPKSVYMKKIAEEKEAQEKQAAAQKTEKAEHSAAQNEAANKTTDAPTSAGDNQNKNATALEVQQANGTKATTEQPEKMEKTVGQNSAPTGAETATKAGGTAAKQQESSVTAEQLEKADKSPELKTSINNKLTKKNDDQSTDQTNNEKVKVAADKGELKKQLAELLIEISANLTAESTENESKPEIQNTTSNTENTHELKEKTVAVG